MNFWSFWPRINRPSQQPSRWRRPTGGQIWQLEMRAGPRRVWFTDRFRTERIQGNQAYGLLTDSKCPQNQHQIMWSCQLIWWNFGCLPIPSYILLQSTSLQCIQFRWDTSQTQISLKRTVGEPPEMRMSSCSASQDNHLTTSIRQRNWNDDDGRYGLSGRNVHRGLRCWNNREWSM